MSDIFNVFAIKGQQQKTLELLVDVIPDNNVLQNKVGTLIQTKELRKNRLTKLCDGRKRPLYNQWQIRDMNFSFKKLQEEEKKLREAQNL